MKTEDMSVIWPIRRVIFVVIIDVFYLLRRIQAVGL